MLLRKHENEKSFQMLSFSQAEEMNARSDPERGLKKRKEKKKAKMLTKEIEEGKMLISLSFFFITEYAI